MRLPQASALFGVWLEWVFCPAGEASREGQPPSPWGEAGSHTARPLPRLHRPQTGRPVAGPGTSARAVPQGVRTEGTQRLG